ncbi:MAG TPA: tripartite tricarboxylate transporter substrate binding protein [Xanthobacteraceae bacterium]|jgi:tripartite-type tricarboxylate transporter receptor subunit TctC
MQTCPEFRQLLKPVGSALFAAAALLTAAAAASAQIVSAQDWPSKPIRVIVPYTPGSATDIVPRTVLEQVSGTIGEPIIVENRPGGGSTIGADAVARAVPDGYTLLVHSNAIVTTVAIQAEVGYDPVRDFSSIAMFGDVPLVMVTAPDRHIKTLADLVAYAKAHPGTVNYASGGIGTPPHLAMERFRLAAGWDGQHIPFKGAPEALTEVMTGRIDVYFSPITPALPLIRAGRLVPLAIAGTKRSRALPDVPTTTEAGYANSDFDFWIGLFAPAKTPRQIVEKVHAEVVEALASPAVKAKLTLLGVEPMPMTAAEMDARIAKEAPIAVALAKAAGLAPTK